MNDPGKPSRTTDPDEAALAAIGHPRGTLAIVTLFGLLFGLGWLLMYVYGYLARGATH